LGGSAANQMRLGELWKEYQFYTRDLTKHARKLAFAAAAICWAFRTEAFTFPRTVYWALVFLIAYFFLDVLQYLLGALFVGGFTRYAEKIMWRDYGSLTCEVAKPSWVDTPVFVMFLLKIIALLVSFAFVGFEFYARLFP
jgi:hypothetical protein